ncbi:hypothetical protein BJ165DRAFT_1505745 [Panaeolus papilionaceus]|nr:hypothetical protein BJ165DRAFT_1505745 [Panaeolus papilionaceus]
MAFTVADYLVTDDLTILLALIAATVFLLNNLYKPQPLVHPILLGRQSDVGRARNPTESAVYRNYGTGLMGRFPIKPGKDVNILPDLVRTEQEAPRTLWSTKLTNGHLSDRATAFGTGLLKNTNLEAQKSKVLLLLNDSLEFIVADLGLSLHSIESITLASSTLLSAVLDAHTPNAIITHAFLLPHLLEHIYDSGNQHTQYTIVVVGEPSAQTKASVASNIKVLDFAEVEREGFKSQKILSTLPKPEDVFTTCFYQTPSGQVQGVQLTHDNVTAGVCAVRALFPVSASLSPLDTLVSAFPISSPYGRSIAYTAIFEGCNFANVPSSELYHSDERDVKAEDLNTLATRKYPIPAPTVMFLKPGHVVSLVSSINENAKSSTFLYALAWRNKVASILEGFVTNQSLWDRLVFDTARIKSLGDNAAALRSVIVSGGPIDAALLTPARIALSIPLVNAFTDPISAGPILASHPLDLQDFTTTPGTPAPTGAPGINVEVKLTGVNDDDVEAGKDPVGLIRVRGPPVGKVVQLEDYVNVDVTRSVIGDGVFVQPKKQAEEGYAWTGIEARATVMTNGSFRVVGNA